MADTPTKLAGFDLLRQRLSIYFGEDDEPAWYEGTVDDYDHDETSSHFSWHRVVFDDGEKRWLDLGKEAASNLLRWAGGAWPTAADRVGRSRRAAGVQLAAKPAQATKSPQAAKLKREVGEVGTGARARRAKQPRARRDPAEADDVAKMGEVSEGEVDEGDEDEGDGDDGDEEWAPAGKAESEESEEEEAEAEEEEEEAPVLSRKDRKRARRAAAPLKSTKAAKAAKGAATTHAAKGAKGGAKGGEAEATAAARSVGASGLPLG